MNVQNTPSPARPARRRARLAPVAGVVLGAGLVLAAPLAASAHIHVTPTDSAAAATTNVTFSFSHGCEDSPTTAIVVDIPEGVTNVVPVAAGGWSIERAIAENGTVTQVTYRAATPIESGIKGEVAMDLRFDESLANTDVPFPITQECVTGSTAWTQVAAEGEAEPDSPAPVVAVGDVAAEGEEHGHAAPETSHADAETTAAAPAADATGLWLGGAGLALGAVALVLAVLALRRRA